MYKKIILALFLFTAIPALAQKDIKVELITPVQGDSLINKIPFKVKVRYLNVGDVGIAPSDTFFVSYYLNGFKVFMGPGIPYAFTKILTDTMQPGDTITEDYGNFSFDFQRINGNERFCVGVVIHSEAIDQMSNNAGCADMNSFWRTGLNESLLPVSAQVFPNPSNGLLTIKQPQYRAGATVHVFDITGREMYKETIQVAEQTLDLTKLGAGVYVYELRDQSDSPIQKGKFTLVP